VTDKKQLYIWASLSETYSLNDVHSLSFLKMESAFEVILWQNFVFKV